MGHTTEGRLLSVFSYLPYCLTSNWLFGLAVSASLPCVCRQLLLWYFLPPDLDGSEPLGQWVHRFVGYFPGGLLAVALLAYVATWKPSVAGHRGLLSLSRSRSRPLSFELLPTASRRDGFCLFLLAYVAPRLRMNG